MNAGITRDEALAKVSKPATLLLVTGILSLLGAILSGLIPVFLPAFLESFLEQAANDPNFGEEQRQQIEDSMAMINSPLNYIGAVVGFIGAGIMCLGAMKMKKLESYGLSMAACIVALVPYLSSCCACIFPIAIGIWGIVVIANQDVKAHFS